MDRSMPEQREGCFGFGDLRSITRFIVNGLDLGSEVEPVRERCHARCVTGDDEIIWTQQRRPDGSIVEGPKRTRREWRELARREHERTERQFREAPFPLYGLAEAWRGERLLGGGWGSGRGRTYRAKSLALLHGSIVEGGGPSLGVETFAEFSIGGGELACVAGLVWAGYAADIDDAMAQNLRTDPRSSLTSTPEAINHSFEVDDVATLFEGFALADEWVARASVGELFVVITTRGFDPADVALARITDIEPYILGSRRVHDEE
jgi:hypothetical protein